MANTGVLQLSNEPRVRDVKDDSEVQIRHVRVCLLGIVG